MVECFNPNPNPNPDPNPMSLSRDTGSSSRDTFAYEYGTPSKSLSPSTELDPRIGHSKINLSNPTPTPTPTQCPAGLLCHRHSCRGCPQGREPLGSCIAAGHRGASYGLDPHHRWQGLLPLAKLIMRDGLLLIRSGFVIRHQALVSAYAGLTVRCWCG